MNAPAPPAPLSYSATWSDASRMLRGNAGLLTAIAGVFLFLPIVLEARFFPQPVRSGEWGEWMLLMQTHLAQNWLWIVLATIAYLIGIAAIYILMLADPRITVGAAVAGAVRILPFFAVLNLILNVSIGIGLFLLIVPGIFLIGKLALASPSLVAETPRAPFQAIRRSWSRTEGRAWSIAGLVVLVYLAVMLVGFALQISVGTVILVTLGREGLGALLLAFLQGLVGSALTVIMTILTVAIYRAIVTDKAPARPRAA